jgi:hypothetical protein
VCASSCAGPCADFRCLWALWALVQESASALHSPPSPPKALSASPPAKASKSPKASSPAAQEVAGKAPNSSSIPRGQFDRSTTLVSPARTPVVKKTLEARRVCDLSHGPREQSDNKAREYANVSGTQKHAQPAGGAFGNLSLFTAGLRPGAGDLRSQQGPDTSARAPAGFDGIIPWLTGTAGASQRDTGALGNGERGRVMSFSTPTSPASPGTKPLKPILKIPARSPSVPIDSNTLLSHVGGFLFQESNQGNPGSARSRVTWNHVNGTCSLLDGDRDIKTSQVPAFKTAVVFCRVHTETKRCAETHGT